MHCNGVVKTKRVFYRQRLHSLTSLETISSAGLFFLLKILGEELVLPFPFPGKLVCLK